MDPASPADAGTGRETTRGARAAPTAAAAFGNRDWKRAAPSPSERADAPRRSAPQRRYRGPGRPSAAGDGRP